MSRSASSPPRSCSRRSTRPSCRARAPPGPRVRAAPPAEHTRAGPSVLTNGPVPPTVHLMAMEARDVIDILSMFEQAEIDAWVEGGWGIDALLGMQNRDHGDL